MQDTPSTTPDDYLPLPIGIPQQLLDQWIAVPNQEYLEIALTRRDLDQLFALLDGIIKNQRLLSQLVVDWSNGNLDAANQALRDSRFTAGQASKPAHVVHCVNGISSSATDPARWPKPMKMCYNSQNVVVTLVLVNLLGHPYCRLVEAMECLI